MKRLVKQFSAWFMAITVALSAAVLPVSAKTQAEPTDSNKNIIAYFPNWGTYNAAHKNINVGMIPWNKVTVINHAFFEVNSSFQLASTDTFADFDKSMPHSEGWEANQLRGHFGEYKYYKSQYPDVKVLVSIGGWTRGNNFHAMAKTASGRATFIRSLMDFLNKYPFIDGFDLDWEYPGVNRAADPNDEYDKGCPGGPEDKENFTLLLKEIREAYDASGYSDKLLSIAAPGGYDKLTLTDPSKYSSYVDWINVMTYDFHGAWETTTGHHAGLYANPDDTAASSPIDIKGKYNTDAAVRSYTELYGVPASKLNVGTPYYSRGWNGVTGGNNGMYGTATGAAVGSWDNPRSPGGQYPYFTLKSMENQNGYEKFREDTYAKTPWLYNRSTGVLLSYEDPESLSARCDYINSNGYGGLIIWEISGDTDDFEMTSLAHSKLTGGQVTPRVAAPTFTPKAGTYTQPQQVTLSCPTQDAIIHYTTDGTEPNTASAVYNNPISVSTTTTVKAKAFHENMKESSTSTAVYTIQNNPQNPEPNPDPDPEQPGTNDPGSGASAWKPNTSYQKGDVVTYTNKLYECLQPHTSLIGWEPANVPALWKELSGSVTPVKKTAAPSFAPQAGTYTDAQSITLSCTTQDAVIRYTTDGTEPNATSAVYSRPIFVDKTTTLKAIAFHKDMESSNAAAAVYTIQTKPQDPGTPPEPTDPKPDEPGNEPPVSDISAWQPNTSYQKGALVSYNGNYYECLQPHTSLAGWEPANVPALWKEYAGTITPVRKVASPSFNPGGGVYSEPQKVILACATKDAVIRYTTDGTDPTRTSTIYSEPILVDKPITMKAKAFYEGMTDSDTATALYRFGQSPSVDLPKHILTGYWQNFDNGATCLKISDVPDTYQLIAVAFADATATPGAVSFTLDSTLSSKLGGYTKDAFISDIANAKDRGQKVILSVGGEMGSVRVNNAQAAQNFANSVYELMQEYGFDGVDIDLENGIDPTYMASALHQLSDKAGPDLIITLAPQTLDMQNVNSGYFRLALNIQDILTVVNTQFYNSGSMLGQDGKVYTQGTVDFITALAAIQLENGLQPDQVGLGLPASSRGAGSGYVNPSIVNNALNTLAKGTSGGSYIPPQTYPSLRGAMTWSINWDALNHYEFANTISPTLAQLP